MRLIGVKCTQESPLNLQTKHVDFYSFMESVTVKCQKLHQASGLFRNILEALKMCWKGFWRFCLKFHG